MSYTLPIPSEADLKRLRRLLPRHPPWVIPMPILKSTREPWTPGQPWDPNRHEIWPTGAP